MFIVRDDRFCVVAIFALISEAYVERDILARRTGRSYTVSYCMKK